MILFQLLFITIIIYFINKYFTRKIENYDARISSISKENCGKLCTETSDCAAFSYDNDKKKCYLSNKPIFYQSANSLYAPEYETHHFRCNKVKPIRGEIDDIDNDDLKINMIYSCQDREQGEYKLNKIVNGRIEELQNCKNNNYKNITEEKYPIFKIEWPVNRKDLDINNIYDEEKNKLNNYTLFVKDKNEYLGQYLFPYKCVKDIPENICIKSCAENKNCSGIEYNVLYKGKNTNEINKNVCCLKTGKLERVPRRQEHENGYFYIKSNPRRLDKNEIYKLD